MTSWPVTQLFVSLDDVSVFIHGPHIQLVDSKTGTLVASTATEATVQNPSRIYSASLNRSLKLLATITDDKRLNVWEIGRHLKLLSSREIPKKGTLVRFTADGQTILVSDKFGDIFSYPLKCPQTASPPSTAPASDAPSGSSANVKPVHNPPTPQSSLISHPSVSNGTLVLGHTSVLTTFVLSHDEKFIISADRDEHIRVSWYPQGYNIEAFCLGSTRFVSALHIPSTHPEILISGGGDPGLRVWDWKSGKLRQEISVIEQVEQYIFVKVDPYGRRNEDDDDEGNTGPEPTRPGNKDVQGKETPNEDDPMDASDEAGGEEPLDNEQNRRVGVLLVQKIESIPWGDGILILFSAIGATAIFPVLLSDSETSHLPPCDFGKPVLDFVLVVTNDGTRFVLVSLDRARTEEGLYSAATEDQGDDTQIMKMVIIAPDGSLRSDGDSPHSRKLLDAMNKDCLIPVIPSELALLDLYANLTSYPKNKRAHDPSLKDRREAAKSRSSRKQQGRLKHKNVVVEMQKEMAMEKIEPSTNVSTGEEGDNDDALQPEAKRAKSAAGQVPAE